MDQNGNPVSGVAVDSHWTGSTSDYDKINTDSNGIAIIYSDYVWSEHGEFTIYIDNLSKDNYVYDPNDGGATVGTVDF